MPHGAQVPLEVGHQHQREEGEGDEVEQRGLGSLEDLSGERAGDGTLDKNNIGRSFQSSFSSDNN